MEAMIPSLAGGEFNLDNTCTSPYIISSPTSPQRFGNYLFTNYNSQIGSQLSENYGNREQEDDKTEFTFEFSGVQLGDTHFICADELFHGGKIKPLKLMPPSQYGKDCPKMPRLPKRIITKPLISPRQKNEDCDPLLKEEDYLWKSKSSFRQKGSKSSSTMNMVPEPSKVSNSTSSWYGKWKLMDMLLFRGASEGHATIRRSDKEDLKNLSFRSPEGGGSGSRGGSSRRKTELVSAHEWHYKNKRAAAEEMRRKTFLPYKKNLLGCMDADPGVREFSEGLALEIKC